MIYNSSAEQIPCSSRSDLVSPEFFLMVLVVTFYTKIQWIFNDFHFLMSLSSRDLGRSTSLKRYVFPASVRGPFSPCGHTQNSHLCVDLSTAFYSSIFPISYLPMKLRRNYRLFRSMLFPCGHAQCLSCFDSDFFEARCLVA